MISKKYILSPTYFFEIFSSEIVIKYTHLIDVSCVLRASKVINITLLSTTLFPWISVNISAKIYRHIYIPLENLIVLLKSMTGNRITEKGEKCLF